MAINIRELHQNSSGKKEFKGVKWLVIAAAALFIAANSFTIVPAGNTGVVLTLGEVSDKGLDAGFHLKVPFIQKVQNVKQNSGVRNSGIRCFKGSPDRKQQNCCELQAGF